VPTPEIDQVRRAAVFRSGLEGLPVHRWKARAERDRLQPQDAATMAAEEQPATVSIAEQTIRFPAGTTLVPHGRATSDDIWELACQG
jgi:hypothetical protein